MNIRYVSSDQDQQTNLVLSTVGKPAAATVKALDVMVGVDD